MLRSLVSLSLAVVVGAVPDGYLTSTWRTSMEKNSVEYQLRGQFVDVLVYNRFGDVTSMAMYMVKPMARLPHKERPVVIVAHHAVGIYHQAFLRKFCDDLADEGYVALLPDFFHRAWSDTIVTGAGMPFEKMNIPALLGSLDDKQILTDLKSVLTFVDKDPEIDAKKVAVLGFCMGGRIAWLAAVEATFIGKVHAAIPYHGGSVFKGLGPGAEAPALRIKDGLHVPVLGHFGELDKNPSLDDMQQLKDLAGDRLIKVVHEGADHGFSCKDSAKYVEAAATAAWTTTVYFLKEQFGSFSGQTATEL